MTSPPRAADPHVRCPAFDAAARRASWRGGGGGNTPRLWSTCSAVRRVVTTAGNVRLEGAALQRRPVEAGTRRPLRVWHLGEHLAAVRRRLVRAPRPAGGAKPALLAAERHQYRLVARRALDLREAAPHVPARQVPENLHLHAPWQPRALRRCRLRQARGQRRSPAATATNQERPGATRSDSRAIWRSSTCVTPPAAAPCRRSIGLKRAWAAVGSASRFFTWPSPTSSAISNSGAAHRLRRWAYVESARPRRGRPSASAGRCARRAGNAASRQAAGH